jgi:hypothetical protein
MKTMTISVFFILLFANDAFSQDGIHEREIVGYACSFSGNPSRSVSVVERYLANKNYGAVVQWLGSNNNAQRYLAVIVLERLDSLKRYTLSEAQKSIVSKIKTSDELVSVCSGCTYWETLSLKKLFQHNPLKMEWWLERVCDKEMIRKVDE